MRLLCGEDEAKVKATSRNFGLVGRGLLSVGLVLLPAGGWKGSSEDAQVFILLGLVLAAQQRCRTAC